MDVVDDGRQGRTDCRHIYDRATAILTLLAHDLDCFAHTQKCSAGVDRMHLVPFIDGHVEKIGLRSIGGVVDQYVNPAKGRYSCRNHSLYLIFLCNIACHRYCIAASITDFLHDSISTFPNQICYN